MADVPPYEMGNDVFDQTNAGTVSRTILRILLREGWSAHGAFRALRCQLERKLEIGNHGHEVIVLVSIRTHKLTERQTDRQNPPPPPLFFPVFFLRSSHYGNLGHGRSVVY